MAKTINADEFIKISKDKIKKRTLANILPSKNDKIAAQVVDKIAFCNLTLGVFIFKEEVSCRDVEGYGFKSFVNRNINDLVGIYDKDITVDDIVADLKVFKQDKKFNRIIKYEKKKKIKEKKILKFL